MQLPESNPTEWPVKTETRQKIATKIGNILRAARDALPIRKLAAVATAAALLVGVDGEPHNMAAKHQALAVILSERWAQNKFTQHKPLPTDWLFAHNFVPETQQETHWCLDASAQMSLRTITGQDVSQETFANQMGTDLTGSGTAGVRAEMVLNSYVFNKGLIYEDVSEAGPSALAQDIAKDMRQGFAPIALVDMAKLPYDGQGWVGNHAVPIEGFDQKNDLVELYDPETPDNNGGSHTITIQKLFDASQQGNGGKLFIKIESTTG